MSHKTGGTAATSSRDLVKHRLLSDGVWALGGRITLAFIVFTTKSLQVRLLSSADPLAYLDTYAQLLDRGKYTEGVMFLLGAWEISQGVVRRPCLGWKLPKSTASVR